MSELSYRFAEEADLPVMVELLADDDISGHREQNGSQILPEYAKAFAEMMRMPFNHMLLAESGGEVVGVLQLVFIPGLSRRGAMRAIIEGVRVKSTVRGHGIGSALIGRAVDEAKRAGCKLVQLTSDKRRPRAHLFYRRLGFQQSHEGFKLEL
ncbi:MAG: GNAT family N-acetyltransferase [Alphaproteobacteria bacterium]|nr:GNAT family N-acetyltransferase [Alphaproteobacteria bacterium]MDE2163258.1 GNAT family N-acetyltransferase [Alphaproteobacteria bacterium]MDE2264691.1 GNAT family N-acetyltransferase [Alphaproteobacteria bacterium]MDE2498777.1 GNAT family N-acetyltransferase [Alphaproteobacteria bacterium]